MPVFLAQADIASFTPILPFAQLLPVCEVLQQLSHPGDLTCSLNTLQRSIALTVADQPVLTSPFDTLQPFTKMESLPPPPQWPDIRSRLLQIEKLHDLCETYLELVNIPAREFNEQQGSVKTCRIELGKTAVEASAETWMRARAKTVLEVMMRLDSGLMEDWLRSHKDYLLAHLAAA